MDISSEISKHLNRAIIRPVGVLQDERRQRAHSAPDLPPSPHGSRVLTAVPVGRVGCAAASRLSPRRVPVGAMQQPPPLKVPPICHPYAQRSPPALSRGSVEGAQRVEAVCLDRVGDNVLGVAHRHPVAPLLGHVGLDTTRQQRRLRRVQVNAVDDR
eukprot:5696012-Prymnesium_polylepis.1